MFSSIILSLAMNVAPVTTTDTVLLDVQEIGTKRGEIRINKEFNLELVGTKRGEIRI